MRKFAVIALSILAIAAMACEERTAEEYEQPGFAAPQVTETDTAMAPGSPGGAALVPSVDSGASLPVMLTEGRIAVQTTGVPAGAVVLNVTNGGTTNHDLAVEGGELSVALGGPLEVNQQKTLELNLKPGTTYTLYCPLLDHRTNGEQTTITAEQ